MRNEEIRRILHLSPINEVMRSDRLRWFGHVQRRDVNDVISRVMELTDMATTDEGEHGERGCYPRCGPRSVEEGQSRTLP